MQFSMWKVIFLLIFTNYCHVYLDMGKFSSQTWWGNNVSLFCFLRRNLRIHFAFVSGAAGYQLTNYGSCWSLMLRAQKQCKLKFVFATVEFLDMRKHVTIMKHNIRRHEDLLCYVWKGMRAVQYWLITRNITYLFLLPENVLLQYFFHSATAPSGPGPPHYGGFAITLRLTTLGRTPLDEWRTRRRDLYLTTHNTNKRQTSMSPVGFEPAIAASEQPQTHALDRAATGMLLQYRSKNLLLKKLLKLQ
jgi:hypothetical protein